MLYAKFFKCKFWLTLIVFSERIVLKEGITVDLQNIEADKNCVWPSSLTKVRSFMGLGSYYGQFVKKFSSTATHMTNLTKNDISFE